MKTRVFRISSLLIGLILLLAPLLGLGASAQGRQTAVRPTASAPHLDSRPAQLGLDGERLRHPAAATGAPAVDVALGEPGLSFRHVRTFGEDDVAYFEDTSHIAWPYGVGVQGANVWIADSNGQRALKFSNSGPFIWQIGRAGSRFGAEGTDLEWITDVAVDASGDIYVVDSSANHVAQFDPSGTVVREWGVLWEWGSDNERFGSPRSVAFDSAGNVYVTDAGNNRIQVFDSSGSYLATLGETGVPGSDNDHFSNPRHITVDGSDNLYIADAGNHRVQIFDGSHAYVATIGVSGEAGSDNDHFNWPMGVALDAGRIFVADLNNHRVQVFDRASRLYVATIGTGSPGAGNDEFYWPSDVAVDSAGYLYVADQGNCRVQQFGSSLTYVRTYGTTGVPYLTDGYHYNRPSGVAVAPDGSVYLTEGRGARLLKLDAAGEPQWTVGEPGIDGPDNDHFYGTNDVDLDSAGRVYVADAWNNRVQIFDSSGAYYATLGTGEGSGNYQFSGAYGVAVGANDWIYVADQGNYRVQIYNASRIYVDGLGETGVPGDDNAHFGWITDVDVDAAGNIYVVDSGNHRLQVFNSSRAYVRTLGVTGECGYDFGHFCNPQAVAVDGLGRIYVSDDWGGRIQVFDSGGAYLTTVGGGWGTGTGDTRAVEGLALDQAGSLYAAELLNHRIHKFAPGYPGWAQTNINGFGDPGQQIGALAVFNSYLYAGMWGGQVWRAPDGRTWTEVTPPWSPAGTVYDAEVFGSYLYFGTSPSDDSGGEVWRTDGTAWERVAAGGFGDPSNYGVDVLKSFAGALYAATSNETTGIEVWRSLTGNAGDWEQVNSDSFGVEPAATTQDLTMDVFGGYLYVGLGRNGVAELWRTPDGTTWTPVFTDGLAPNNTHLSAMAEFDGYFYIGFRNVTSGGEVWRSADGLGWEPVITGGLGNQDNGRPYGLIVFDGRLYLVFANRATGAEVLRSADGADWERVADAGWGDSNNGYADYFDKAAAAFGSGLYVGTLNDANGGEVWMMLHRVFLPLVLRNH